MNTKDWGPPLWKSMFMIAANYPLQLNNTKEHSDIKKHYKNWFISFQYILPCKYCRESYKGFLKELPIDPYLISRKCLMYWLYLIKDKVNKKLIYHQELLINELKNSKRHNEKQNIKIFRTTPSPPFKEVCQYYEKFRAGCSDKTKSCSVPIKK